MKISGIHWRNFKSFLGDYKLEGLDQNLTPQNNVILIGGNNGAGKTTLLESVFLCFYGRNARNLYPSRGAKHESYNAYLHSLLNRKIREKGLQSADMVIELQLKDVPIVSNVGRDISIRRHWSFEVGTGEDPKEDLEILENGKPIEELDKSEYNDRLQAVLPFNVSQFFFFDGEKIQDFASDSDSEFASSLKDVLGINLYSTLAEDVREVRKRILQDYNKDADSSKEIKEREAKLSEFLTNNQTAEYEIRQLADDIASLEVEVEKIDNETRRITNISANDRVEYLSEKDQKIKEKETLEEDYVNMAKDYLPFILASHLFEELEQQLDEEKRIQQVQAAKAEIEPKITQIIDQIFDNNPPPPFTNSPGIRRYYESKIDGALRNLFGGELLEDNDKPILHNLRPEDAQKVKKFIHGLNEGIISVLNQKADKLKEINIFLERIRNTQIRSGSNSEVIQGLFDRKNGLLKEAGAKQQRIKDLNNSIQENKKKIEILHREITNWQSRSDMLERHRKEYEYCDKMHQTIKEFQKRFQATKTIELEKEILFMWKQLNHKPDLIARVQILPESNFEVKLFNAQESEIDKTKLSAGEKEIYAISLLWALIQVSGKKMPILIDTPFGRLDSIHRRNLTKNYFPIASHQVILLSQDEEVTGEYYEILKPCLAQEWTIENKGGNTEFSTGYPFAN